MISSRVQLGSSLFRLLSFRLFDGLQRWLIDSGEVSYEGLTLVRILLVTILLHGLVIASTHIHHGVATWHPLAGGYWALFVPCDLVILKLLDGGLLGIGLLWVSHLVAWLVLTLRLLTGVLHGYLLEHVGFIALDPIPLVWSAASLVFVWQLEAFLRGNVPHSRAKRRSVLSISIHELTLGLQILRLLLDDFRHHLGVEAPI